MDYSKINNVFQTEADYVVKKNEDMLKSPKGIFTNGVSRLANILLIPILPIVVAVYCFAQFRTWYGKLLSTLLVNIITLPIALVRVALEIVIGIISLPLALIFEGVPALFSKKYRNEYKLSRAVKKLAKILKLSQNPYYEYSEKFELIRPKMSELIREIEDLNKQLGRHVVKYNNPFFTVESFNEHTNNDTHNNTTKRQNKKVIDTVATVEHDDERTL